MGFLRSEGPSDSVQTLIDHIPGAEAAIEASRNGGGLSRVMGGGLMAIGTRLARCRAPDTIESGLIR